MSRYRAERVCIQGSFSHFSEAALEPVFTHIGPAAGASREGADRQGACAHRIVRGRVVRTITALITSNEHVGWQRLFAGGVR